MHILDIVQNSITAKACLIQITISDSKINNIYRIEIKDDGYGMEAEIAQKVIDPYFTTRQTRKVGLGIPLFKQNAERTGGTFNLESNKGIGTVISASFEHNHLDRPVLGDIEGTIVLLAAANPEIDFIYKHKTDIGEYEFNTREIKQVLGETPINEPKMSKFMKEMIHENLVEIQYNK
jgi:hypothetical protein